MDDFISEYHKDMKNCSTKPADETTVLIGTAKCDLSPLMFGHLIHECNVNINSEMIFFVSVCKISKLLIKNSKIIVN